MSNSNDLIDEYIGYTIFEESTKGSGGGKPPKRNTGGAGCGTWCIIIALITLVLSAIGSCSKSSHKTYSSRYYRSSYSTSSYSSSHRSKSSGYTSSSSKPSTSSSNKSNGRGTNTKSKSSDPYDAKSYAHPDDLYYDHSDDFWDYEDAEDYWEEHQDD